MPIMTERASLVFQAQLRKAIRQSGKTTNFIAVNARISAPIVWRFAKGERGLNQDTADKLADSLGVTEQPDGPDKEGAEKLLTLLDHY
jgi:hypothetical protein